MAKSLLICLIGLLLTPATWSKQAAEEGDTRMRFVFPFYPAELDILIGHLQTKVSRRQDVEGSRDMVGSKEVWEDDNSADNDQNEAKSHDLNSTKDDQDKARSNDLNNIEDDQNEVRSLESMEETDNASEERLAEERLDRQINYFEDELFRVTQSLESCEEINAGNHEAGSYVININDKGDVTDPPVGRANKLEVITALRAEIKAAEAKLDLCRFKFWTGDSRGEVAK